jgi:hypothetical protein
MQQVHSALHIQVPAASIPQFADTMDRVQVDEDLLSELDTAVSQDAL